MLSGNYYCSSFAVVMSQWIVLKIGSILDKRVNVDRRVNVKDLVHSALIAIRYNLLWGNCPQSYVIVFCTRCRWPIVGQRGPIQPDASQVRQQYLNFTVPSETRLFFLNRFCFERVELNLKTFILF